MTGTIKCDIVSSQREVFSGEVTLFVAPGVSGELGIYPRHAPLITILKPGALRVVVPSGEETLFFVSGGILEVVPHLITVAADEVVRAADVDEAAAMRAREAAERELQDRTGAIDLEVAQAQLMKSMAELRAVELLRRQDKRQRTQDASRK